MSRKDRVFSYALIFRNRSELVSAAPIFRPAAKITELVRQSPQDWQCLLMKRNYKGHEWDTFGGTSAPFETPENTLKRELLEESGLEVRDMHYFGQIWRPYRVNQKLIGHGFVVVPKGDMWWHDKPELETDPSEVSELKWFSVPDIHDGEPFLRVLGARLRAFLAAENNAELWSYLSEVGKERCRAAGDEVE